jgi:hypothetical protein
MADAPAAPPVESADEQVDPTESDDEEYDSGEDQARDASGEVRDVSSSVLDHPEFADLPLSAQGDLAELPMAAQFRVAAQMKVQLAHRRKQKLIRAKLVEKRNAKPRLEQIAGTSTFLMRVRPKETPKPKRKRSTVGKLTKSQADTGDNDDGGADGDNPSSPTEEKRYGRRTTARAFGDVARKARRSSINKLIEVASSVGSPKMASAVQALAKRADTCWTCLGKGEVSIPVAEGGSGVASKCPTCSGTGRARRVRMSQRKFHYEADFDENGVLFWIGSRRHAALWENPATLDGGVVCARSGDLKAAQGYEADPMKRKQQAEKGIRQSGDKSDLVGRATTDSWATQAKTFEEQDGHSWWQVDLGERRTLHPTHYTLRHGHCTHYNTLRTWQLEGSQSGKSNSWVGLHTVFNSDVLLADRHGEYSAATWRLRDEQDLVAASVKTAMKDTPWTKKMVEAREQSVGADRWVGRAGEGGGGGGVAVCALQCRRCQQCQQCQQREQRVQFVGRLVTIHRHR